MSTLTAQELVELLQQRITESPEAGALPAVAMDDGRLVRLVGVYVSSLDGGLMLVQARAYDSPPP